MGSSVFTRKPRTAVTAVAGAVPERRTSATTPSAGNAVTVTAAPAIGAPLASTSWPSTAPLAAATVSAVRARTDGVASVAASASPTLVPSPWVGVMKLPSPSSFHASRRRSGGAGAGSGRTAGADSAATMASFTALATSPGARVNQNGGRPGSFSFHGRASQPVWTTGMNGSGLFAAAWPEIQAPTAARSG